jgi:hypothetical protein
MKYVRTLMGMAVATALLACTSTARHAAEYKQQFYLAEDVDTDSKAMHLVYVKWPGARALLATGAAAK